MRTFRLSTFFHNLLESAEARKISILVLVLGLLFFVSWLVNYSWTIIATPYPAEYREGAILLFTDYFIHGINPFSLANHPLMTNNYGFLYNVVVLPFAMVFGNTLAVHRLFSILFILASSALIVFTLTKVGNSLPFAVAGGTLLMASLLFQVTPLARPDSLGEFFFLLSILLPWQRKFDSLSLLASGFAGMVAFLAKPYFVLSIGIVGMYVFIFISKRKGLFYALFTLATFLFMLYVINIYFECYFLDTVLNNLGNSALNQVYMWQQLTLFAKVFSPSLLLLLFAAAAQRTSSSVSPSTRIVGGQRLLHIIPFKEPLFHFSLDYFLFFLECALIVNVVLLSQHLGAYMIYFFQLVTPALILVTFQPKDVLYRKALVTVPLILVNLGLICFWLLSPNKLSMSQQNDWEKLYRTIAGSKHILNSPVLVPEMVRLGMRPVDSGQTEYFFNTQPYDSSFFAPDYKKVSRQGEKYREFIKSEVQGQSYDRIIITTGFSPFANPSRIDQFYDKVEQISVAMPQTGQYWLIQVYEPSKK